MDRWCRALTVFLPLCIAGCVPPPAADLSQPPGGPHVVLSNGGSVINASNTQIALSGHTLKIGFFTDPLNLDCSVQSGEHMVFRVITQPAHGTLNVEQEWDYPQFPANNALFKCDGTRI